MVFFPLYSNGLGFNNVKAYLIHERLKWLFRPLTIKILWIAKRAAGLSEL